MTWIAGFRQRQRSIFGPICRQVSSIADLAAINSAGVAAAFMATKRPCGFTSGKQSSAKTSNAATARAVTKSKLARCGDFWHQKFRRGHERAEHLSAPNAPLIVRESQFAL